MANPLKQLAGETAIYGLSTILARIINFLFVPIYTRLLTTASYGTVTEFMAYIAVLQVVMVMGLETGCFRFANKEGSEPSKVYSSALLAVFALNAAFFALLCAFSGNISSALGYEGYSSCIIYIGGILFLDSVTAILFAKLRQEHRAVKFAVFKTVKILTETAANLLLFLVYPKHGHGLLSAFIPSTPDFSYVIFAIFISCVVCALLFVPDLLKLRIRFDKHLLGKMLAYSIPLMLVGLPGTINDLADRILFRFFDTNAEAWRSSLGVFQAAVKMSVIMNLFIQMFRFAAEPFFFQRASQKDSRKLYAIVMEFFTAFCGLIFLGIVLFIDPLSYILGQDFRSALGVVPVMLLSYMLLGMLFNVSMWYKLSEQTWKALWITLLGLAVTIVVNVVFMPRFSYWAAAAGHLCSYLVMLVFSAFLGAKYYPIPYRWGRVSLFFLLMAVFFGLTLLLDKGMFPSVAIGVSSWGAVVLKSLAHCVVLAAYLACSFVLLRNPYKEAMQAS